MKNLIGAVLTFGMAVGGAVWATGKPDAAVFTLEKNDARQFRIHCGADETPATREMMKELAAELKRVTGVTVEVLNYAPAAAGDFFVATQPWSAEGAWTIGNRNGVMGIHGSDPAGTQAALRHFIDKYVKPVPTEAGRFEWENLRENHGPQWSDVYEKTLAAVAEKRAKDRAPEWANELVNYVNVEPARAYSFPLASAQAALTPEVPETPYVKSLDGLWRYNWCGAPAQRPLDFYKVGFDDSKWYTLKVPSCVELQGYGVPIYRNIIYPHPATPPNVDSDYNPVSSYRTTFTVPENWGVRPVFLRFEGVYSAYYVWVNGEKVGFSEDSCTAHEFNVTKYLKPGENLLAVEVYRWSDGAFLEDQDYIRYSGIYRHVMLFAPPQVEIRDFFYKPAFSKDYRNVTVDLAVELRTLPARLGTSEASGALPQISAALYDADFKKVADFPEFADGHSKLELPDARLWSAEEPYLYTLVITAGDDIRSCKAGFMKTEIQPSGAITVNGKIVKFKGVNRHDASPENGRSVTREEILRDILLMKQNNVDTVRTSHYPNDPYFFHLCERYGLYVQLEANVESHGMRYGVNSLASPPSWTRSQVDRCRDMVINWRNLPCVFTWSWGNEAGQGPTFDVIDAECAKLDGTRPTVYRQDCERFAVDGPCYPTVAVAKAYGLRNKCSFFFEYAHSMGNALGCYQEYWDVFYAYDSLTGGCVWDWIDQPIWKYTDRVGPDGKRQRYLAYGGDFDDENDGNFCANGVIDPERHETPKLAEMKQVHRNLALAWAEGKTPVVGTRAGEGAVATSAPALLWNRFSFTKSDAYDASWHLIEDGVEIAAGALSLPGVPPLTRQPVSLPLPAFVAKKGAEYFLNVEFSLKQDALWAKKGHVIASDQLPLEVPEAAVRAEATAEAPSSRPEVVESADGITVKAGPSVAVFSRATGTLSSLAVNGKPVLTDSADGIVRGPRLTCMRAFTDNDIWLRGSPGGGRNTFYGSGLSQLRYHVRELRVAVRTDKAVTIRATVEVNGAKNAGFTHGADYEIAADGTVTVRNEVTPYGRMPTALPRLGLSLMLDTRLENVSWYGRGPWENYVDRCTGSFLGFWESTVTEQYVAYCRIQDNGYKTGVRWAAFTDKDGDGVLFKGSEPLCMQALHYSCEDLEFARHRNGQERIWNEKPPRAEICLNLDLRQLGLGGGSCGPRPEDQYIFKIQPESWSMTIAPCKAGHAKLAPAARTLTVCGKQAAMTGKTGGNIAGETLIDFADPANGFNLGAGKYLDPAEAAKQLEAKADGLHIHLDAAKMNPTPPWCTLTVPDRLAKAHSWLGQGVVLVMRKAPFRRVTNGMALNLTDRDGETFQFLPRKIKTNLADGTIRCSFAFTEAGHSRPWGGGDKANGRMDAPVRLTAINAHYSHNSGEGEVVFVRLEGEAQAATVARPVRSVEPISTDTTYPGAAPFPGAKALTFTVSPAFRGTARLALSYDSSGNAMQGAMTNLTASTTDGTLRFPCDLSRLSQFQFVGLDFKPSTDSPKGPWKIVRAEGEFEQTSAEAFRLDVETGNFLHVVRAEKENERPVVVIRNPADTPQTWETTLKFSDVFDRRFEIPFNRTLAPGEAVRLPVPWPLPAKGMWYLAADVRGADGSTMTHESRFAAIDLHERTPIVAKPKFRFGIHYHGIRYLPDLVDPTIDALVAAGAKFTRTDYGFMFGDVRPRPDVTDWSLADDLLRRLRDAGLSLDIIVQSTPGWAVDPEIMKTRQGVRRRGCLPSRPGLLRDFCQAIAARYGPQIDYYEIGNEWDLASTNTLTHDEAVRMQREAMEGIHAACPEACVTPNGWATASTDGTEDGSRTNPGLIERFAEEPELYDVWALHCHGSFDAYVNSLQEKFFPLRERTGMKNKPWTSHETALSSFGDAELDVARTVWAKTLYAWAWGSRDYIWYNLRATGWLEGGEPGYGLITAGFRPRAGYAAFAALTAVFQGLDADGRLISRHPLHLYRFKGEKDGFRGIVLAGWEWGAETPHGVRVRTDAARASVSDHMGNRSAVTIKDGIIEFPLDLNPKALLLEGATTAELAE